MGLENNRKKVRLGWAIVPLTLWGEISTLWGEVNNREEQKKTPQCSSG